MTKPVYVKELPSLKLIIEYSENEEVTITEKEYNLLLPHLSKEFRNNLDNSIGVSCFPLPVLRDIVEGKLSNYIKSRLINNNTKIFFDNVYEGHTTCCIKTIYNIISKINLDPANCYFISGGMQARELHNKFCNKYNIQNKINIIILNSWERHLSLRYHSQKDHLFHPTYDCVPKEKLLLCFNRIVRPHRVALLGLLYSRNLVKKSYYSFFHNVSYGTSVNIFDNIESWFSQDIWREIKTNLEKNYNNFPLLLNNADGSNTNTILPDDEILYRNSYFSLVTETFFFHSKDNPGLDWDEESVFFSEKIFKPIICKHPFILVSRPKSLHYLKKLGYKTFHPYINESYDDIDNDADRLLAIVNEVERLSQQTTEEWIKWQENVKEIVEHNFNVITSKSRDDFEYFA